MKTVLGALALCLCGFAAISPADAGEAATLPIRDWTGNGVVDVYDVIYYNTFIVDPAHGRKEWPSNLYGSLAVVQTDCCGCHESL